MLRGTWERLRHAVEGGMRQRVTRVGLWFSFATVIVGLVAFLSANNLLFLLLGAMIAMLLVSGFLSRLSLSGLELDFVLPDHVTARSRTPARVRIRNEKTWMPSFSLQVAGAPSSAYSERLYFPVLPAGATIEETVPVVFARRGLHHGNSFRLLSRFPFGFAERRVDLTLRQRIIVYPCLDPHPDFERVAGELADQLDTQARGRGADFYRIRPYEPLESVRHVDWKATAHTGELQVREFAREREPLIDILLDPFLPPGAEAWFERAVDGVAFLAWEMSRRGSRIRLRCGDFDCNVPADGDVYTILKFLALVEPRPARSRGKIIAGPSDEDSLPVLISAAPEAWLQGGWDGARTVDREWLRERPAGAAR